MCDGGEGLPEGDACAAVAACAGIAAAAARIAQLAMSDRAMAARADRNLNLRAASE
jgi:hypothetical protein